MTNAVMEGECGVEYKSEDLCELETNDVVEGEYEVVEDVCELETNDVVEGEYEVAEDVCELGTNDIVEGEYKVVEDVCELVDCELETTKPENA